jgi:hypothetical protein
LRHIGKSGEEIYGTDEKGNSLEPEFEPGILEVTGTQVAASVGNALVQSFNAGLGTV